MQIGALHYNHFLGVWMFQKFYEKNSVFFFFGGTQHQSQVIQMRPNGRRHNKNFTHSPMGMNP
jgi:hypothetical protein